MFAAALLPFAVFQLLTRSCYALRKTSWPALANLAVNLVTVLGAALALRAGSARAMLEVLVLSYAVSYVVGCVVLALALGRTGVGLARGVCRPVLVSGSGTMLGAGLVLWMRASLPASRLLDVATLVVFAAAAVFGTLGTLRQVAGRAATAEGDGTAAATR